MDAIYIATAIATGDGRNGPVATEDGLLDTDIRVPKEMGGAGGATNPEQLFAAGYAACFHSALKSVELSDIAPDNEHFARRVAVVMEIVRNHVEHEEKEVFPRMRQTLSRARAIEIGDAMHKLQRKARAASPKATRKAAKKTLQRVA
jgi:Ohr subfamily peroxiredoxin